MNTDTKLRGYIYQPANISLIDIRDKKISGWIQCFTSTVFLLLANATDNFFDYSDKVAIARYLTDMLTGGRDEFDQEIEVPSDHDKMFNWKAQQKQMIKYLAIAGCNKTVNFTGDAGYSFDQIYELAKRTPCAVGTNILGGHINAIDHITETGDFCVKDPAGNWKTKYADPNGDGVIYEKEFYRPLLGTNGKNIHALWIE